MQLKRIGINWVGAQTHFHLPALVHNCTVVLWHPLLYHFLFSVAVETEISQGPKNHCEEPLEDFDTENGTPPLECGQRKIYELHKVRFSAESVLARSGFDSNTRSCSLEL